MKLPIYLDYMSTTPVDPRVADVMLQYLTLSGNFGNAGSRTHRYGWLAEEAVENARQQVADLINANAEEIIWTSGATEANNLALKGAAHFYQRQGNHIITCMTEHKAVLDPCAQLQREGFDITYLKPQANGLISPTELENALRKETLLVSIMHVNNEIGVIQNIQAIGEILRARGILFHVDAAQSFGKIPIDLKKTPVDLMSFSAHKIYGPKGIGALYLRGKPKLRLQPLMQGGGQERGLRPGTLPVHQIAAMGKAAAIAQLEMVEEGQRILTLREQLYVSLKRELENLQFNGDLIARLPGNLNVSFPGTDAQKLFEGLADIAVSSGSACTSGSSEPSYVLKALGVSDALARSSIRFSMGRFTTEEEIAYTIKLVAKVVRQLRC